MLNNALIGLSESKPRNGRDNLIDNNKLFGSMDSCDMQMGGGIDISQRDK
jgi:hypothetical protein